MLQTTSTHEEFERIAREYLAQHPGIPHTWSEIQDISGGRTDLVCWPGSSLEVFASLAESQITVGSGNSAKDFESFGRGLSDKELAREAWAFLKALIRERGGNDA